jgi:hypothetical protein
VNCRIGSNLSSNENKEKEPNSFVLESRFANIEYAFRIDITLLNFILR